MSKELIRSISDLLMKLRFLVGAHFIKPIREMEKTTNYPPGFIHVMRWILSKGNNPVSMSDLAVSACISKPNLTTMMDRLYQDGLIERTADKNDRRIVNVSLTQKGVDFLHEHKAVLAKYVEDRLTVLEEEDLIKLKRALEDITDVIRKMGHK
ncbi:MarR family winged helix-turn-helix transcriptional regulator [Sinanaerobacter chloroacetimidivorans]|jgi:DNA-binding MarR family transcriptional regulator|uniref:MarR family transcriptional regulator n=1 Tax=Sinanaerobacter chloroacetimidivorans TaxID=2818044 RepID=A0A8J7W0J3_9FIRM|nr:MarR family transcriptional regulator [Sinanaerobacter chloroacetimidivorans]MBR0597003.1 MarR family transcriptional regulator [Sinanaerobacter chloroacetimidivorans]